MTVITRTIFECHLHCAYKGFLKRNPNTAKAEPNEYADLTRDLDSEYHKRQLSIITQNSDFISSFAETQASMAEGVASIANATFAIDGFDLTVDMLEKTRGRSALGLHYYRPLLFARRPTVNDKMLLALISHVLGTVQGRIPDYGIIVSGEKRVHQRVKISKFINQTIKMAKALQIQTEPRLFLNPHCNQCEYRAYCRQKAKEKDDLSLLGGVTGKEVARQNSKGIFTVTQLSYTFRPRRLRKKHP